MKFFLSGYRDPDQLALSASVAIRPGVGITVDTEEEVAVRAYILTIEFLFWGLSASLVFRQ